ncbi:histidine--tRNA ligase [Patescibacteria group bacterium]|nr:histidine--tRNA ligase [Patescibacteria group bacterium]
MKIEPYKGVRDFYPEDQRIQNHIFSAMRRAVESYGYEEYNASILESTELYLSKTSEEIVNEQTYTFTDRGDRSVTLRPEMTPTVARMVAARKRELGYPLRLYCIQNFFRYERPQRGRLREFWQLNADLFGVSGIEADIESIALAYRVMKEMGADDADFVIKIGNRGFLDSVYDAVGIPKEERQAMTRLLDAKDKGADVRKDVLDALAEPKNFEYFAKLKKALQERGIENAVIDANIARGFDYYTGLVFEVFDTNPENPRAMFGGGRYDNLIGQYLPDGRQAADNVPAVGFAMGDVIARDFLETHNLLPKLPPATHVYIAPVRPEDAESAAQFADELRAHGVHVALGMKHEKIGDHIKHAVKLSIPYFIGYGEKEKTAGTVTLKVLATEAEEVIPMDKVADRLLS